jgi:uncharacterized damage-inducible protein DinB
VRLLDTLLAHNEGTTRRLIEQSAGLTDAQLDQEFDLGLRTVRRSLDHIIESMEWWTDLMTGRPPRSFEGMTDDPLSLAGLQCRLEAVVGELARLAHDVERHDRWEDHWPDRADQRSRRYGATLVHVLTHGAHHRSQVIHMLRRLGIPDVIWGDALGY